ncbi:hypothetical protein J6590_087366 [Homalodisca vitripennis]|nr:hypothetical protein J6590_087366 [Homalodisca vitripennis]
MASGGGQYMRSAPLRRLRHPLDESPVWSLLGSALGALVALLVGLPVLLVLAVLLPFTLAARWFLLLLYWNRRRPLISAEGLTFAKLLLCH